MAQPKNKKVPAKKIVAKKKVAKKPVAPKQPAAEKNERAVAGDNSGISGTQLKAFVDRIENLEEEKAALAEDIKEIYSEAKAVGFVPKIIKKIVANRRKDKEKLREEKELTEMYAFAIDPDLADVLS